jgi:AcrR family transcriptional regulator
MAATTTRRRLAPEARRELIEGAAARLFASRGYAGTTLDQVAGEAGVTKPIVYRHFRSKKDLYLALLARHRDDMPSFFERTAHETAWDRRLKAMLELWFQYVRERPHGWKMLFRDTTGDEDIRAFRLEVQAAARALLAALVADQAAPGLPPREVEPLAELVRNGLAGLALWWLDHPDVEQGAVIDASYRLMASLRGGLSA